MAPTKHLMPAACLLLLGPAAAQQDAPVPLRTEVIEIDEARDGGRWAVAPIPLKSAGEEGPFQPPPLADPDMQWVDQTLAGMTLPEKIGQMLMPSWSSSSASSTLSTYDVGGFVFLANPSATILGATNSLQQASAVPLLFSIDCEAGAGARVSDATAFPMNMALGATGRTDLAFQQGVVTARECRAMGVQIAFGPVLDTNTEAVNPIIGIRSFGDDPAVIEHLAEAYIQGAASAGLLTTAKHYPGHGATRGDSHQSLPVVDLPLVELERRHVRPYERLIARGTGDLVMTAHVWYPALDPGQTAWPATLSTPALGTILRGEIGFQGVIISDAFNMAGLQLAATTYDGVRIAVLAGMDVILMPPSVADAYNGLYDAVQSGAITTDRINESVRRILVLKSRVGLPGSALVADADRTRTLLHADHVAVAEEIGRAAIASARVREGVLPLRTEHRVLVLPFLTSSSIFYLYPHTEFSAALDAALPNVDIQTVSTTVSTSASDGIVASAPGYDRIVVTSRAWQPSDSSAQVALLRRLVATGVPVVYLSFGSPYHVLDVPELENIFCSFSSHYASQRQAVEVLLGRSVAGASWPVAVGLNPPADILVINGDQSGG